MYVPGTVLQKKPYTISKNKYIVMNHLFCETNMCGFENYLTSFRVPGCTTYIILPSHKSQAKSVPTKIKKRCQVPYYSNMHARYLTEQMIRHMHVHLLVPTFFRLYSTVVHYNGRLGSIGYLYRYDNSNYYYISQIVANKLYVQSISKYYH